MNARKTLLGVAGVALIGIGGCANEPHVHDDTIHSTDRYENVYGSDGRVYRERVYTTDRTHDHLSDYDQNPTMRMEQRSTTIRRETDLDGFDNDRVYREERVYRESEVEPKVRVEKRTETIHGEPDDPKDHDQDSIQVERRTEIVR